MYHWGNVDNPYQAYYGQVAASDLAELYKKFGQRLFAHNVREFLGNNDINDGIASTVRNNPKAFWYFHNGVTILAKKVRKKLIGGNERLSGNFEVEGIEIVNGAQTVGTLGSLTGLDKELAGTRVPLRIVSLETAPVEFSKEITVANNTQNRISAKDFISLDRNQERLFFELKAIDVEYLYKSTIRTGHSERVVSVEDAAVALACSQPDVELAVVAKAAIGRLWDTSSSGYYNRLFNDAVSGQRVWNLSVILKSSETALQAWKAGKDGRRLQFANYLNRVVEHCVFRNLKTPQLAEIRLPEQEQNVRSATMQVADALYDVAEARFPGCYYASFAKNISRCRSLVTAYVEMEKVSAPSGRSLVKNEVKPKRLGRKLTAASPLTTGRSRK